MNYVKPEFILQFLEDEGLASPVKTFNLDSQEFEIHINDPFSNDTKTRLGIGVKDYGEGPVVVFNAYKSVANLGDEYRGNFWQFVKLIKDFENINDAKFWFLRKYVYHGKISKSVIIGEDYEGHNEKKIQEISLSMPEHFSRLRADFNSHRRYYSYLNSRGVSTDTLKQYKIFINEKQKRIVFPVYEDGNLIFYTGRSINPEEKIPWLKSKGHDIYPIWNLENVNGDIINIFEGIFDAMMIPNSVAILGATNTGENIVNKILEKNYLKINIILDNDIEGRQAKYKLAKKLSKKNKNVFIYNFDGIFQKDFNEMKIKKAPFELDKRLIQWNLTTEIKIKMELIK